jgi:hypothetical protein
MVMQEQSKRLAQPLRWTRAGRLAVAVTVLVLAVGSVLVVIASSGADKLAPGCIEVTFASTLGGATDRRCGTHAREACAAPGQNPALAAHGALREACRKAGLPFGAGARPTSPTGG